MFHLIFYDKILLIHLMNFLIHYHYMMNKKTNLNRCPVNRKNLLDNQPVLLYIYIYIELES